MTYRSGASPGFLRHVEANQAEPAVKSESSMSAPAPRLAPERRSSLPDVDQGRSRAVKERSRAPDLEPRCAAKEDNLSRPASQPVQGSSRRTEPKTGPDESVRSAEPPRDSAREIRLVGSMPPPSSKAPSATSSREQPASPSRARQESTLRSRFEPRSSEARRLDSRFLSQLREEPKETVRQSQNKTSVRREQTFIPSAATPSSDVAQLFPSTEESPALASSPSTPALSTPPLSNKDQYRSREPVLSNVGHDIPTLPIPNPRVDLWPELPANSSRVTASEPTPVPAETGPPMRATDASLSPVPSFPGWSARAENRWPELLQESPVAAGDWEEALRSQQRTGRLDREQAGGE